MAVAFCFTPSSSSSSSALSKFNPHRPIPSLSASPLLHLRLSVSPPSLSHRSRQFHRVLFASGGGDGGFSGGDSSGGGGGGDHSDESGDSDNAGGRNRAEALMVLKESCRKLESLPKDLAAAIQGGRIPGSVVDKYFELEKSGFISWLMQFAGFRERLLADDLFLFKVFMECGVGLFTKTAAEYQKRQENFFNELEVVFADVVMAIIADFMLVYLPAPTVSLRPPVALNAGAITKFFHGCPDNAFQIALSGTSYSLFQRIGAVVRNGSKLFVVGTASSLASCCLFQSCRKKCVLLLPPFFQHFSSCRGSIQRSDKQVCAASRCICPPHHEVNEVIKKDDKEGFVNVGKCTKDLLQHICDLE